METTITRGFGFGTGLGLALGLGFALVIRLVPEWVFLETVPRGVLYGAQVVAAPTFVWITRWLARLRDSAPQTVLTGAVAGALAFDGLALGFWPELYGQQGLALAYVASTLLWAFAWIVIAGQLMNRARS
jgi:predicted permease